MRVYTVIFIVIKVYKGNIKKIRYNVYHNNLQGNIIIITFTIPSAAVYNMYLLVRQTFHTFI